MLADIWALGMILFSMINPSVMYPYRSDLISRKHFFSRWIKNLSFFPFAPKETSAAGWEVCCTTSNHLERFRGHFQRMCLFWETLSPIIKRSSQYHEQGERGSLQMWMSYTWKLVKSQQCNSLTNNLQFNWRTMPVKNQLNSWNVSWIMTAIMHVPSCL